MDWRTIEEGLHRLSVNHNGLMIPGRSIQDILARHCTALGVLTDNEAYPVYIPGSGTLLKYKDSYSMICTRHQLNQTANFEDVCLMINHADGHTKCITSGGARWFDEVSDGDHQQIVIFDFTESCLQNPELKPMFFDFRQQHPDIPADSIVTFISYGYPTGQANIDYESGKFALVKRCVLSRFAAPGTDDALHIIELGSSLDFDPDGMSGPTFCVVLNGQEGFSVHFAGITVRGG